jgi:hypothetical protein
VVVISRFLQNPLVPQMLTEQWFSVPLTFATTIAQVKTLALHCFDREIAEKQLCYHTREHVVGVQRRSSQIFQAIRPHFAPDVDTTRLALLLDLCAIAHDVIQIFAPQTELHTARRRTAGVSEAATIETLLAFVQVLKQLELASSAEGAAQFTDSDLQIIKEAIAATICDYDPVEQSIFQPALYRPAQPISCVARILALADIGTLGMEGIAAYNAEGRLLLLEENPDVRSLLKTQSIAQLAVESPDLCENIRQRLLNRARFQVNLAKSRLQRCPQELVGLPAAAIPILTHEVFQYLTPETIRQIEATTPTAADTSLTVLIAFFDLEAATIAVP